jgi:hypothetical protein
LPSTIERLQQERRGRKFAVLLVNYQERPEKVSAFVKAHRLTPPVVLDRDGAVTAAYRVTGTPTVIVIDRKANMVARAIGPQVWTGGSARRLLDLLVDAP